PIKAHVETRASRYVRVAASAVIAIQRQPARRASIGLVPGPQRRIDEKQILIAVVVEIEKRHPTPHRFWKQLVPLRPLLMHKRDAGVGREVRDQRSEER